MTQINVSISFGINRDNIHNLPSTPNSVQLGVYKYELYEELKYQIFDHLTQTTVQVIHLPIDILRNESNVILTMMKTLRTMTGCKKFVIHPNKNIKSFLNYFLKNDPLDLVLCVENFQWKRKKEFRSPLETVEFINFLRQEYESAQDNIRLCFDTSHAEEVWFDFKIMSYLLPYIDVIHLSNRVGKSQHMPFNIQNGDLNLVGFVKELISRYKWSGDIVLEYMDQYHHRLNANAFYLKRLINERTKTHGA